MGEVADTPGGVVKQNLVYQVICSEQVYTRYRRREDTIMSNTKVRIKLKAYEHRTLDKAAAKIVETVKRTGGVVSGPVPLPTEVQKYTILRAVHKYKDAREQFEMRTHKRLIDIYSPNVKLLDKIHLPAGVDIKIKL